MVKTCTAQQAPSPPSSAARARGARGRYARAYCHVAQTIVSAWNMCPLKMRSPQFGATPAVKRNTCLLYTSDAADDM
eukprot:1478721-Rhodomonas_salina.2